MFSINKWEKRILSYRDLISKNGSDIDFLDEKMSELYFTMKDIAPSFAKKGIIKDDFRPLIKQLYSVEKKLPTTFILSNNPVFNPDYNYIGNKLRDKDEQEIIEYIVANAREFLISHYSFMEDKESVHLGSVDLLGECVAASWKINIIAKALNVSCIRYTIEPAFCEAVNVYEQGGKHQFCFITIGNKSYIVDITYSQFFTMRANNLDRIGIPLLGGCHVGVYMTLNEKRRTFAEKLMRDGWVEATSENIKLYLDGFALSYRNGLYYENQGKIDYTTNYTAGDYMNFLNKVDSQLNHEGEEVLGRQRKLLKDPHQNFKIGF